MSTRECRSDSRDDGSTQDETAGSDRLDELRREKDDIHSNAAASIRKALSGDSVRFLAASTQEGGQ